MKHPTVIVMGLDEEANYVEQGRISLVNNKIVFSDDSMTYIARTPLSFEFDTIDPVKEPERFLRSLYLEYRSLYCTARKAVDL